MNLSSLSNLSQKQKTASGELEKLKACIVPQSNMEKQRIKKPEQHFKNKDKRMPKINLQPPKQTLYRLSSLNLLKTLGHHVHLQEGSNYTYPQHMHLTALLKVETLLEPISKLKSLAITLSDFHWNMHITFRHMPNTLEPHPIEQRNL
jgi:hypothetical protein